MVGAGGGMHGWRRSIEGASRVRRGDGTRSLLHPGHQHARLRVGSQCVGRRGRQAAAASIQLGLEVLRSVGEARGYVVYSRVESHATAAEPTTCA